MDKYNCVKCGVAGTWETMDCVCNGMAICPECCEKCKENNKECYRCKECPDKNICYSFVYKVCRSADT